MSDGGGAQHGARTSHCPACGREADAMGVLDNGERIYVHGPRFCFARLEDSTGYLEPAVDQIQAHQEADS